MPSVTYSGTKFDGNGALSNGKVCYGVTNHAILSGDPMDELGFEECEVNGTYQTVLCLK